MKPIGPMMWEHRLIDRMLRLFEGAISKINEANKVDKVDCFFPIYRVNFHKHLRDAL